MEPIWFTNFRKENDKRWDQQTEFNKQVMNFIGQQTEFNKQVINRLDNIEQTVCKNSKDIKTIFEILKRNNLK